MKNIEKFTNSYIATLFWLQHNDTGETFNSLYNESDLAFSAKQKIQNECSTFYTTNRELLGAYCQAVGRHEQMDPIERAGHDFALTRNRHGAGFWDRSLGALGDRLTAEAQRFPEQSLFVGDDGKVHIE